MSDSRLPTPETVIDTVAIADTNPDQPKSHMLNNIVSRASSMFPTHHSPLTLTPPHHSPLTSHLSPSQATFHPYLYLSTGMRHQPSQAHTSALISEVDQNDIAQLVFPASFLSLI